MKKALIISALFLFASTFCPFIIRAQTTVGGLISIDTHWTISGSPYIVTQNILLDVGVTLTIDPFVIVQMDTGISILIRGTLRAIGSDDGYITFTSNASSPTFGDWANITFDDQSIAYDTITQEGCIMQYCIVEYGGREQTDDPTIYGTVQAIGAYPYINKCTFRKNLSTCFFYWNDNIPHLIDISDNLFEENKPSNTGQGAAIKILDVQVGSTDRIRNNVIQNNYDPDSYGNPSEEAMFIQQAQHLDCRYNKIIGNHYKGEIAALHIVTVDGIVSDNLICNNECPSTVTLVPYTHPDFKNNIIVNNRCINMVVYISDWAGTFHGTVTRNTILNNYSTGDYLIGIRMDKDFAYNTIMNNIDSSVFLGNPNFLMQGFFPAYASFHHNNIHGNSSKIGTPFYSFGFTSASSDDDFDASQNWWGSNDVATVNNGIYDFFDNFSMGVIVSTPFLADPDIIAPISPPSNVVKTDLGNQEVKIEWEPNIESDVAGYKIYWQTSDCCFFDNSIDVGNVTAYTFSLANYADVFAVTAYDDSINGVDDQFEGHESWFSCDQTFSLTGIQNDPKSNTSILVYPNPTSTTITFSLSTNQNAILSIFNLLGEKVKEERVTGKQIRMDVSSLPQGLYLVRTENRVVGKFVKE